ncbi:MAG: Cell division protein FtsX [Parcubacteria group bacterium GW2011_GWA2_46_9]|nr:MAG: Cell division protein FtsX [Parcubacteria group bacterium GW2011_GWA2_46_9]
MMRSRDLIRLSTRMFKTRPMRTSLTILGVGVGIGAILFLVSLGYGMQTLLLEKITTSESLLSLDINAPESGIINLGKRQLDYFSTLPHVKEVSANANIPTQISFGQFTGDALANVIKPSFFRLSGLEPMMGRFFLDTERESDKAPDTNKVIISSTVIKLFNLKPEEAIGKKLAVTLFFTPRETIEGGDSSVVGAMVEKHMEVEIIGVIENNLSSLIYLNVGDLPDLPITEYAQAKVRVESSEFLDPVREQIKEMGFIVTALSDTIAEANKIFKAIQVILALFGIVALLVAAIGMFNTVTIALLERTQEIGIMKAIGAGSSDIFIMFLTESALMGFFGGVSGVILGYAGGEVFNFILNILASRLGGQPVNLFVRPLWFVVGIIVFSTIVGFLTGVLPARRAARLKTLQALRYK